MGVTEAVNLHAKSREVSANISSHTESAILQVICTANPVILKKSLTGSNTKTHLRDTEVKSRLVTTFLH